MGKNIQEAKKLLSRFKELWVVQVTNESSHELTYISRRLIAMKLSDEFFIEDLTSEEKEILLSKVYILGHL